MTNMPILNYHDAVIYRSDLSLLDSQASWLNDSCIHFQMTRLQHGLRVSREQATVEGQHVEEHRSGQYRTSQDDGNDNVVDDLFLDPTVISYLMHQCKEDDEDFADELSTLHQVWNLPQLQTSTHSSTSSPDATTATSKGKQIVKRVFVPINDQYAQSHQAFIIPGGGSHWSLLVWILTTVTSSITASSKKDTYENNHVLQASKFYHFDSLSGYNAIAAKVVSEKLSKVLHHSQLLDSWKLGVAIHSEVTVDECETPQQSNGYDCGLFMLGFAEALSTSKNNNSGSREKYKELLINHVNTRGGKDKYANELRKQISDDIRGMLSGDVS